jgi:hypothetical protein
LFRLVHLNLFDLVLFGWFGYVLSFLVQFLFELIEYVDFVWSDLFDFSKFRYVSLVSCRLFCYVWCCLNPVRDSQSESGEEILTI